MNSIALNNRQRIVELWCEAELVLVNNSIAQDMETSEDDPDGPYLRIVSYRDAMGHTTSADFTEENIAAARFTDHGEVVIPGRIERIDLEFTVRFYARVRPQDQPTAQKTPSAYEIMKCALLDIGGLLELMDSNIMDTTHAGLRESIDEMICYIRRQPGGAEWLRENFPDIVLES